MERMRIALVVVASLAAASLQWSQPAPGFPGLAQLPGRVLDAQEAASLIGGESYIDVSLSEKRATVTTIPRDSYGMDYSRASIYTVEAKNDVVQKAQKATGDYFVPTSFPKGESSMKVATISGAARQERYGSTSGEWVTTTAGRKVQVYEEGAGGKPDYSKAYTRADSGYFLHTNTGGAFEDVRSAGCILVRKDDLDRIVTTLKADRGRQRFSVRD